MKGIVANIFVFILLFLNFDLNAEIPPSGAIIENKAEAIYYDIAKNEYRTKYSNEVVVTVASVIDFILTPLEITKEKYRGDKVYFNHEFINKSNSVIDLNIEFGNYVDLENSSESSADFEISNLKGYIDTNKNGIIEDTDIELNKNGVTVSTFDLNESKYIILEGEVPNFVDFGSYSKINLTGSIPLEKALTAIDTVNILVEPELEIIGYADKEKAKQLDTYLITQETRNISETKALPTKVLVDSSLEEYIVVESEIPANTTFQIRESGNEDLFVYQIAETDRDSYITKRPADLTQISKVAFLYKDLESRSIEESAYSVKINNNATQLVKNKHKVIYTRNNIEEKEDESEDIIVEIPEIEEELNNYNNNFLGVVNIIRIGNPLNIEANAASCNTDPSIREEYNIEIVTDISKDIDNTYIVRETSPNSGIFRVSNIPTLKFPENDQITDNSILEVTTKDKIMIKLRCNESELSSDVLVDPLGVVFDSHTNLPLSNIKIELLEVDNLGNEKEAIVYDLEGNEISNIQYSDEDGLYWFPRVEEGLYVIKINDLESYTYPSKKSSSEFKDREININGSYGKVFEIKEEDLGIITLDIPLDPIFNNNLLINKEVDKDTVEIGEVLGYTLSITNLSKEIIEDVKIIDTLPFGFQIINAEEYEYELEDNIVTFNIPQLLSGETKEIRYNTLVKMNAKNGTAVNTAIARNEIYTSNIAKAKVEVRKAGIFENPLIMGKVYKDCNVNNQKDEDEIGIPGVKIYMQNGTYAITDKNGNYKFYNLQAKTQVLRIDKTTLVKPYDFKVVDNRNAKDPFSAFADLKYGELHRRDFRDINCSSEAFEGIEKRIENITDIRTEVERSSERNLEFNDLNINNDLKREESEGLINENEENINKIYNSEFIVESDFEDEEIFEEENKKESVIEEIKYQDEDKLIKNLNIKKEFKSLETTIDFKEFFSKNKVNNELDFFDLKNDDVLSQNQISIRIKNKNIGDIQLLVNNKIIEKDKIGQTVNFKDKGIIAVEYIAVNLKTGINILEIRMVDPFGNIRDSKAIKVLAAGDLDKIKFNLPKDNQIPANSNDVFPVLINLTDKNDIPVTNKFVITLDTTIGYWDVEDINKNKKGIQTTIENGEGIFNFIPPNSPDKGEIRASINDLEYKENIYATTYLRDLFAVGIVDGMFDFSKGDLQENIVYTELENEVESFEINENGRARVALFLKGKVKGDYLLTLAYDSDKNEREKLYRDIEPEEFYPIYGDSSINGFEAQSTTKLYIKIAKGNSFIMYGDLNTRNFGNDNTNLGNYNRTLTGVRQVYNNQKMTLSYYLSQENFGARVREIPGQGSFGPYEFANNESVVINSEKVSIITRDRATGALISEEEKTRFVDYEINGFYEGIVFREAIPSVDRDFNPVFVRVEYEVETDNEKYLVYGLTGEYELGNNIKIGLNHNKSEEKNNKYGITSTYIEYEKNNLKLNWEIAQSNKEEIGYATRLNAKYNKNGNLVELRYQKQDDNFENEFSSAQNISEEATLRSRIKINKNLNIKNTLFLTKQNELNKENKSIKSTLEHTINDFFRIEGGIRYTTTQIENFDSDSTMGSARLSWQPEFLKDINTYFEYEQDLDISEINRQEIGIEYRISEKSNIYIQQEMLSNLSRDFELTEEDTKTNRTIIGTDYNVNENTDVYSEYRINEVISEQDAEAVVGVRNTFDLNEKWKGNLALERIESVEGESQTSTSFAGALQHTKSRDWKTIYRLQYLKSQDSAFYSGSVGYIRKINDNFSFLAKDSLAYEEENKEWRNRFYSGVAYRDNQKNELNYLVKYENEYIKSEEEKLIDHELSFQFNKKVSEKHILSGLYAYKNIANDNEDLDYSANWITGRYMYNLNEDWDLGLSGGYLFDNETAKNYMLGLEAGYLLKKNMWLSLGYNFEGLSDNNYSNETFYKKGIYIRFRLKLGEEDFKWLQ